MLTFDMNGDTKDLTTPQKATTKSSRPGTGTQAIEKAVSVKPNLILLDLDLPAITDIDAARVIKKIQ